MQTPPLNAAARAELVQQPLTAVLATQNADETIRMSALIFEMQEDGTIRFNTFENTAVVKNLRRNKAVVKNLRRDPRCSVLIDATAPWPDGVDPGYGVHYWGTATVEGPTNDLDGMGAMFARYVDGNVEKARAYAEVLVGYGDRVYIRFRPDRDVNWDFRMG
jgi:hypothetical protein